MRLAPFSTSNSADSTCPLMLAQCKAVRPLLSGYCDSNMGGRNERSLRGDAPEGKEEKNEKKGGREMQDVVIASHAVCKSLCVYSFKRSLHRFTSNLVNIGTLLN